MVEVHLFPLISGLIIAVMMIAGLSVSNMSMALQIRELRKQLPKSVVDNSKKNNNKKQQETAVVLHTADVGDLNPNYDYDSIMYFEYDVLPSGNPTILRWGGDITLDDATKLFEDVLSHLRIDVYNISMQNVPRFIRQIDKDLWVMLYTEVMGKKANAKRPVLRMFIAPTQQHCEAAYVICDEVNFIFPKGKTHWDNDFVDTVLERVTETVVMPTLYNQQMFQQPQTVFPVPAMPNYGQQAQQQYPYQSPQPVYPNGYQNGYGNQSQYQQSQVYGNNGYQSPIYNQNAKHPKSNPK